VLNLLSRCLVTDPNSVLCFRDHALTGRRLPCTERTENTFPLLLFPVVAMQTCLFAKPLLSNGCCIFVYLVAKPLLSNGCCIFVYLVAKPLLSNGCCIFVYLAVVAQQRIDTPNMKFSEHDIFLIITPFGLP
jgi:hypothetical protein